MGAGIGDHRIRINELESLLGFRVAARVGGRRASWWRVIEEEVVAELC